MRTQDVDLMRFELVPNLVLLLTTAGIVNAGLATAREWEDYTIKELLLAPISRTILIVGKLLSGWLTTLLIAAVVLLIGAASGYLRPENPIYWISTLVIILLIALASACLGVAIGAAARRFQRVTAIGIPLSIDLFFLVVASRWQHSYQVGFRRLLILSLRSMALMRYRWRSFIILLKDSHWIYLYSVEPLLLLECLVFCRYAEACWYRS
jgi:ABC-type transport system involved in cytochrome c biogenesis permease component